MGTGESVIRISIDEPLRMALSLLPTMSAISMFLPLLISPFVRSDRFSGICYDKT